MCLEEVQDSVRGEPTTTVHKLDDDGGHVTGAEKRRRLIAMRGTSDTLLPLKYTPTIESQGRESGGAQL